MVDTVTDLQNKSLALRAQVQDLQLKASKAQEYVEQQQARYNKLITEREAYVKLNPSAAPLVTPAIEVKPEDAQQPSGCLFAGKSKATSTSPPTSPANAAAHPKLITLNTQVADCANLIAVWKKRVEEYTSMASKLAADAEALDKRAQDMQQTATQTTPQQQTPASYGAVLVRTDINPAPENQVLDTPFTADAINVRKSNQQITGNTIRDTILQLDYGKAQKLAEAAHRDAVQLIPQDQFAAGELENLRISNNHIHSSGKLQGIFASDGVFRNLTITGNTIDTLSDHKITLNGLVGENNYIEGNRDAQGNLLIVQLNPIRLGGNLATGNVWILSVLEADAAQYGYSPLNTGKDGTKHIQDNRTVAQNRDRTYGDVNLINFPMREYKSLLRSMTIDQLLVKSPAIDAAVAKWLVHIGDLLPGSANLATRTEQARAVYQAQRNVPISELARHNADLQNFFIQALAKWVVTTASA